MRNRVNISDLADQLIAEATSATKTASADAAPAAEAMLLHPVVVMLKKAAAALRAQGDTDGTAGVDRDGCSLGAVEKLASVLSSAGKAPLSAGASAGKLVAPPKPPSLATTNTGVTASGGGSTPAVKISTELRKFAQLIREQEVVVLVDDEPTTKTAHVLNAACGLHRLVEGLR